MPLTSQHFSALDNIVGSSQILTAIEDLIPYSFDGTAALKQMPAGVVFPTTTDQIRQLVQWANTSKVSLVTRGSGTGLSGGSIPSPDSIVVCLVRMNQLIELDKKNLTLLAEAGITTQAVSDAAAAAGLFYPPDPGSMRISTLGGNVAENSGGLRGLKYGVTRNYVMGMETVLPNGEIIWLGNKCVKDVAGFSLKDIFIGSEGTLGIITKVLLKLIPKPQAKITMVASFGQMDQAAETISSIIAAQIIPCTLEFLDRTTIHCVENYAHIGLPLECEALILIETDGAESVIKEEAARMVQICREHGCHNVQTAQTEEESIRLASARRTAFSALARVSPTTILEDATVPRSELAHMIRFIQQISKKYELRVGIFGHMGDGNLHPTFLTDERNLDEMQRVEKALHEIFDETLRVGGTITGEHGIGLAKKGFLPTAIGKTPLKIMQDLKNILDPNNILNPGKMFAS